MTYCVNSETVNTHINVLSIGVCKVFCNSGVLCVEVNAVTCDLCILTGPVVPVKALEVTCVVLVVGVKYGVCGNLCHSVVHIIGM